MSANTDLASRPGWIATHEGERSNIFGDDGSGCDYGKSSQFNAWADDRPSSNGASAPHQRFFEPIFFGLIAGQRMRHAWRARVTIVRERHPRSNEHVVFDDDPFPNQDLVLDRDIVANYGTGFQERVVADVAAPADSNALHDMDHCPNVGGVTNFGRLDQRRWMDSSHGLNRLSAGTRWANTLHLICRTTERFVSPSWFRRRLPGPRRLRWEFRIAATTDWQPRELQRRPSHFLRRSKGFGFRRCNG